MRAPSSQTRSGLSLPNSPTTNKRDEFVERFWEKRNPEPGSSPNVYKEQHYERIRFANSDFSALDTSGWKTDRGRIHIVHPTTSISTFRQRDRIRQATFLALLRSPTTGSFGVMDISQALVRMLTSHLWTPAVAEDMKCRARSGVEQIQNQIEA